MALAETIRPAAAEFIAARSDQRSPPTEVNIGIEFVEFLQERGVEVPSLVVDFMREHPKQECSRADILEATGRGRSYAPTKRRHRELTEAMEEYRVESSKGLFYVSQVGLVVGAMMMGEVNG